jgi:hypothetical protein
VVYVIVFPYLAIATTLLYFDLKERQVAVGGAVPSPV